MSMIMLMRFFFFSSLLLLGLAIYLGSLILGIIAIGDGLLSVLFFLVIMFFEVIAQEPVAAEATDDDEAFSPS